MLKVTFALNLCNTCNSGNIACLTKECLDINWKAYTACDLNFIVSGEVLTTVTGSLMYTGKSGNISATVLDRDVVTTGQ